MGMQRSLKNTFLKISNCCKSKEDQRSQNSEREEPSPGGRGHLPFPSLHPGTGFRLAREKSPVEKGLAELSMASWADTQVQMHRSPWHTDNFAHRTSTLCFCCSEEWAPCMKCWLKSLCAVLSCPSWLCGKKAYNNECNQKKWGRLCTTSSVSGAQAPHRKAGARSLHGSPRASHQGLGLPLTNREEGEDVCWFPSPSLLGGKWCSKMINQVILVKAFGSSKKWVMYIFIYIGSGRSWGLLECGW